MADIKVTEGVGKTVETKTISSKERQVVVLGDPTTAGGVATVDATNGLAVDVKAFTPKIVVSDIESGTISVKQNGVWTISDITSGTIYIRDILGGTVNIKDNGGTISIDDNNSSITVDGTVSVNNITVADIQSGTIYIRDILGGTVNIKDNGGSISIDDNGSSITVDGTVSVGNLTVTDIQSGTIYIRDILAGTVNIKDNGGSISVDDNGSSLTIDGTVTVADITQGTVGISMIYPGTTPNALGKAEDAGHTTGDVGVMALAVRNEGGDDFSGTDKDYVPIATDAKGHVFVRTSDEVEFFVSNILNGTISVKGDIAHDSVDSGYPVKIGGKAYNFDGTIPGTAVAENDRANFITDVYGRQLVETTHPNYWSVSKGFGEALTSGGTLVANPGAGLKLYLTDLLISTNAGNTITIIEGLNVGVTTPKAGSLMFAANGGVPMSFKTPIALTANYSLGVKSTEATIMSVTVSGYTAA